MTFSVVINFPEFPIWKGTLNQQKPIETAPFTLGWDSHGFIRQDLKTNSHTEKAYADDEYSFITAPPGMSEWGNRFGRQYLDYIKSRVPSVKAKNILDIGGGSAFLGEMLTSPEYGASLAVIVDPALRTETQNKKVRIVRDYFPSRSVTEDFDLIVSCNCLEHVPDPVAFLTSIRHAALARNADVILIFPDVEKQFEAGDMNALLHEHISCFTKNTAERLFRSIGFQVIHHQSAEDRHVYHLKTADPILNIDLSDTLLDQNKKAFFEAIEFAKTCIRPELDSGLKIAFHGATNGLNNTLFLAGLAQHPNIFVFDGDSSKTGRFLPTALHPIRISTDPSYKTMDKVYISALTFYPECFRFLTGKIGISPEKILPISPKYRTESLK